RHPNIRERRIDLDGNGAHIHLLLRSGREHGAVRAKDWRGGGGGAAGVDILIDEEIDAALVPVASLGFVVPVDNNLAERQPVVLNAVEPDAVEFVDDGLA